jgi:hypothetical protein
MATKPFPLQNYWHVTRSDMCTPDFSNIFEHFNWILKLCKNNGAGTPKKHKILLGNYSVTSHLSIDSLSDIVFPPSKLINITLCRYGYIYTCLYDTREGAREWAEEIKDMLTFYFSPWTPCDFFLAPPPFARRNNPGRKSACVTIWPDRFRYHDLSKDSRKQDRWTN